MVPAETSILPPMSPSDSEALMMRFMITWRTWVASASIGSRPAGRFRLTRAFLEIEVLSRPTVSRTRAGTSMDSTRKRPLPAYASICWTRSAARLVAVMAAWMSSWAGDLSGIDMRASSMLPRMAASRLLKSWAMPPASRPRLSSRWDSCRRRSNRRCSSSAVLRSPMSRTVEIRRSSGPIQTWRMLTSTQNRRPSWRRARHSKICGPCVRVLRIHSCASASE